MNITELARKLNVPSKELLEKLPALGFDIGKKAIKVDNQLAQKIIQAWRQYKLREKQKEEYLKIQRVQKDKSQMSIKRDIKIPKVLTVREFSEILNIPVSKILKTLLDNGVVASLNQRIDYETAAIVAQELGFSSSQLTDESMEIEPKDMQKIDEILEREKDQKPRPPVIVVLGHVDHGKTKLLDAIRETNIVESEVGGITQHIGAYQVSWKDKHDKEKRITFIDTPGHEAFTAMRSRGAQVADIAILVVAADDGVKPQTLEAIKIAQNTKLPIIVAINKIDKPEANIEKTKKELAQHRLIPEEWGGTTMMVPISAKERKNIDELLDAVLLLAEIEKDKITANPQGQPIACVIEAHISKEAGPIATILVKNGTFHQGDILQINNFFVGKIKVMKDWQGRELKAAPPSMPVQILGFKIAPKVGDLVEKADSIKGLKRLKEHRLEEKPQLLNISEDAAEQEEREGVFVLKVILRADVFGSLEAIIEALKKLEKEDIKIKIIRQGLGNITENDIFLAEASNAVIFGFNVRLSPAAAELWQTKKDVEIEQHRLIYDLIQDVKEKINQAIQPEIIRKNLGKVKVLAIFRKEAGQMIIGGRVLEGEIRVPAKATVFRQGEFIIMGEIKQLQMAKQDVDSCLQGQECGILFKGQPLIEKDDILEVYQEEQIKKKI